MRNATAVERSPAMLHFNTAHLRPATAEAHAAMVAETRAARGHSGTDLDDELRGSGLAAVAKDAQARVTWTRKLQKLPGKDGAASVTPG